MNNNISLKNFLKLTLTLIPLYATIGCIILWSYLDEIGRLGLFTSILDSTPSLIAITFAFTLVSISLLCIFTLPSIFLYSFAIMMNPNSIRRVIKIDYIPWVAFLASVVVIATIMITSTPFIHSSWVNENLFPIMLSTTYITAFIFVHILSYKRNKPIYFFVKGKQKKSILFLKEKATIALGILFSGLAIVVPFKFILGISSAFKDAGVINLALISLPMIFVSFVPAICLFSGNDYKTNYKQITLTSIATLSIFICCTLLLPGFSSIVSRGTLKQTGVIETSPHIYAINKQIYPPEMFPISMWKHLDKENKNYIFLEGTILLSLGGKILICPDFVISTQNKYLKYNLDNLFSPRNEFHSRYIKQTMKSCALINSSEITPWDGIVDGENAANR